MPQNYSEIKIPVPYGYIACKVWGSMRPGCVKIVAVHGWQDNAGTFDRLIPLLNDDFYVVAIDLSGHGYSSHLPHGVPYVDQSWVIDIKKTVDFFKLDKVTLLGHSMGGNVSNYFASIFPSAVERIIHIDQVKPFTFPSGDISKLTSSALSQFLEVDKKYKDRQPVFRVEDALEILMMAHQGFGQLDKETSKILMKRATRTSPDGKGLVFTRDNRLNGTLVGKSDLELVKTYYKNLKCDILSFKATKEPSFFHFDDPEDQQMLALYKTVCGVHKILEVDGDHYVHLTHPERVAPAINQFIIDTNLAKRIGNLQVTNGNKQTK